VARIGARDVQISFTAESLTHVGGLFLLHRFVQQLGLRSLVAHHVRFDQRNNHYAISESLLAWLYPLGLGLGRIETARVLQRNGVFEYLTGLPTYPDPQTLRRFLIRVGQAGLERFRRLHDHLRRRLLGRRSSMVLDLDTSLLTVDGRQEKAEIGYNRVQSQETRPAILRGGPLR
jgi:Transposase DDE domain group 1